MNLIQTLEQLDKLILDRAPIPKQRALINAMREQLETYDKKTEDLMGKISHLEADNVLLRPLQS